MNTDRDRLLKENEERARKIKEELIALREAMLQSENALTALAIERTNLESEPGEEQIEISPELQQSMESLKVVKPRRIWPKVALGGLTLAGALLVLNGLGIFNNDGSTSDAQLIVPTPAPIIAPSASKGNDIATVVPSSIPPSIKKADSTSAKINNAPNEVPMNILPGSIYTSEISYSMKSSAVTVMEVQDAPQITLHLNHAPQSFFIPMKTSFRIDSEGIGTMQFNGSLMVLANSKKRNLEIRFEPRRLPLERKILDVSSTQ